MPRFRSLCFTKSTVSAYRRTSTMPELKRRAVAGSFIFKFPDGDTTKKPQVALFRRSDKVRTYQNKYAPISGSVESSDTNPLATAWRELHEETSLTNKSLRLYRQGKPYSFIDDSVSREWTINPFAFTLTPSFKGGLGEEGINLDWEHDSYAWFDPDQVSASDEFGGVPRLLDSLRRVWFDIDLGKDAGRALREGLTVLQEDHESGARQLAGKALGIFADVVQRIDSQGVSRDVWWSNVRLVGWHLWKNGRESMGAPILSGVVSCLHEIEKKLSASDGDLPRDLPEEAVSIIERFADQRQQSNSKISDAFTRYLDETQSSSDRGISILTLSSSSTITNSLLHALTEISYPLHIRILESRPLYEGVKTARTLSAATASDTHSSVTIYTDASAAIAAQGIDIVLIGADLIDRQGNVSNKTGSLPAVLAARHVAPGAKVVVLADREKVLPFEAPGHEENDEDEVARGWGEGVGDSVGVKNVYFEWVEAKLVDDYVTEAGVTTSEGIAEWAEDVKKRADALWGDL